LIPPRGSEEVEWRRVLAFLQRRQDLLDAVVFSGGEPTLQDSLPGAMEEVRQMGFRIGLHSAGIKPAAFAKVVTGADWVGFDIKALPEDCQIITRVGGSGAANWRSLEYLLASGVDYECRTTVHWHLFEPARLLILARRLSALGVKRFAVQLVRTARMLDPHLSSVSAQVEQAELWAAMRELFPEFVLRG
jgi:anaerobic ribonucleoside-triphosphate reductase activating protein